MMPSDGPTDGCLPALTAPMLMLTMFWAPDRRPARDGRTLRRSLNLVLSEPVGVRVGIREASVPSIAGHSIFTGISFVELSTALIAL